MKNKKGISFIVLIISIIVLLILATVIIMSLINKDPVVSDNPIESENKVNVPREETSTEGWIDIAKDTPERGISLLIGKSEKSEAIIKFKSTTSVGKYTVNWGDGASESYESEAEASHTYSTNSETLSDDGYLFEVKITPESGDLTKFVHTQTNNSPLLWCQVGCDTLTSCEEMLYYAKKLKKIGISAETSLKNVTNMRNMFYGCSNLTSIPNMNTSKVTNMDSMFWGCSALENIPQLDTSSVTNMKYMLYECKKLINVPLLDTSQVTDMNSMLYGCSNLKSIPVLETRNTTNMSNMFKGCSSLTTIPKLDINKVTFMKDIFSGCTSLNSISLANTGIDSTKINNLFNQLPTTKSGKIDITGNPGESGCDKTIATKNGWKVI